MMLMVVMLMVVMLIFVMLMFVIIVAVSKFRRMSMTVEWMNALMVVVPIIRRFDLEALRALCSLLSLFFETETFLLNLFFDVIF